jgi:8-oxo-dGTP pyrophosphatase MutT (NUDIX family)
VTCSRKLTHAAAFLFLHGTPKTRLDDAAQGGVEADESLVEAAKRELLEETGPNVDVWPVGRVPAGAFSYPFPATHKKKFPEFDSARVRRPGISYLGVEPKRSCLPDSHQRR